MPKEIIFSVFNVVNVNRLDSFLAQLPFSISRSHFQKLIEEGHVLVNGKTTKPSHKVRKGDLITITVPDPCPTTIIPENIPLDIYYEDEHLLVVNKPAGIPVHPGAGCKTGTLVNALVYHCKNLSSVGGVARPGIVHRIDKGTSGLLMVAKTDFVHQHLAQQLKNRTITRKYIALVYGKVAHPSGTIETYFGRHPKDRKRMAVLKEGQTSRIAITHYNVLKIYCNFTLLECRLGTGRTHQIRVHLSYLGHPVVGDTTYGKKRTKYFLDNLPTSVKKTIESLPGYALHAQTLGFIHPVTNQYLEFTAPLPSAFSNLIELIEKENSSAI